MSDLNWGQWLKDKRKAKRWKRRDLAERVKCDPSLVTLMERDGHRPRRDLAARIGRELVNDPERAQIVAGFCPLHLRKHLLEVSNAG